jgi:transposase-like protein
MARARREVKLPYRELYISCPHCHSPLVIGTIMDKLLMSRRTCPKCGNEFLIENDVPRKLYSKKPSRSVGPTKAKKPARAKLPH